MSVVNLGQCADKQYHFLPARRYASAGISRHRVPAGEKGSISTNRKSTAPFPTSNRWTVCVTLKSPKGWHKTRFFRFCLQSSTTVGRVTFLTTGECDVPVAHSEWVCGTRCSRSRRCTSSCSYASEVANNIKSNQIYWCKRASWPLTMQKSR